MKLDTGFARHPKLVLLPVSTRWAHVKAMCWLGEARTDGRIPSPALAEIGISRRQAQELVDVGLWHVNGSGWEMNDWLEFNPSKEQDERRREVERKKKAKWRGSTKGVHGGRDQGSPRVESTVASRDTPARVDPTRPDPSPQDGSLGGSVGLGAEPPPDPPPLTAEELKQAALETLGKLAEREDEE